MKQKALISACLVFLILFFLASIWSASTNHSFYSKCFPKVHNYQQCYPELYADLIIMLPARAMQAVLPIRFAWGPETSYSGAVVCHRIYYGLKIINKVVFITKEDCPPI